MKPILTLSLLALLLGSCKKDLAPTESEYAAVVKNALHDSLTAADFAALDFSRAARLRVDSVALYCYRVPFVSGNPRQAFVLVKTDASGHFEKGKIVHLDGQITKHAIGSAVVRTWEGTLTLHALDRKEVFTSPVVNGYITAYHRQPGTRTEVEVVEGLMPEVIITYVRSSGGGFSWSDWFLLESLLGEYSGDGGGYYGSFTGDGGSGGGGTGDSYGGNIYSSGGTYDPTIHIDPEIQDANPGIDILQYIKCFSSVPDAGATCSIELFTDIPVDSNPDAFFDLSTGSPGHSFICVSKINGTQRVSQNIGFYPKSGYKSMTYAPTAGKLVDNAHHEFNASLVMKITPAQLATVLLRMQQLSTANYDVDQYNCTDWALNIFNSVRTNKLEIPLYGIPDSPITQGTRTPQGLYQKLLQMFNSNDPEKGNITIGIYKGYAGGSTGPCQ